MISHDGQAYGALIQFPGDTQNAARQLNLDMQATDRAAQSGNPSASALANWNSFLAGWTLYFKPIDDAWSFNPLGSAAFADQADIEDWRKRMIVQQKALAASGVDPASLPESPDRVGSNPLDFIAKPLTDLLGDAKWIVLGGVALVLILKFSGSRKGK